MSKKEKFESAYEALADIYTRYLEDVMKTIVFILIAIGWVLNSEKRREAIARNKVAYYSSLRVTVFLMSCPIFGSRHL